MLEHDKLNVIFYVNELQDLAHGNAKKAGWWDDVQNSDQLFAATPAKLCLIHSEISEAMEGHRKNLQDDKLSHHPMFAVELADAIIRIFDLAGAHGIKLAPIILEKIEFNSTRQDHKKENRSSTFGKKY